MVNIINYQGEKVFCYDPRTLFGEEIIRIKALQKLNIFIAKKDGLMFVLHIDRNTGDYTAHKFDDISSAIRAQEHISGFYHGENDREGEIPFFDHLNTVVNNTLGRLERWGMYNEAQKCNSVAEIESVLYRLEKSRLEIKKQISEQVAYLTGPKDSLGRKNIGAKRASGLSAKDKSRERIRDSDTSQNLARKRRQALKIEELILKRNLQSATLKFGLLNITKQDLSSSKLKLEKGKVMFFIQSIWIEPYYGEAQQLITLLNTI